MCCGSGAAAVWGGESAGRGAPSPPGAEPSATASLPLRRVQCSRPGELGTRGRHGQEHPTRGQQGWDRAVRWGGRKFAGFFSSPAETFPAPLAPGVWGSNGGACTTTPLGREGAMLQGLVIDEAVARRCACAGSWRGSTGARAIPPALDSLMGTTIPPLASGSRGQLERVRDGWQTRAFDDCTDGLGATADAPLCGLLEPWCSSGQSRFRPLEFSRPPRGPLVYKLLRKLRKPYRLP